MIGPGETKMIYLRVQSAARMTLPVRVLSDQALFQKAIRDYTVYGALFGLLVLVMLYFVAVGSFLYKGTPTWLALYSIFFGLHTAIRGGFVRLMLPDALLGISNPLQLLVIAGLFFTGARFFRLFLSLKSHSVTLDRIMTFFQYLSLTFILLPMLPTPVIIGVSFLLIVINPLFSISLAFYFWRKGVSNAGLFAFGWTVAHLVAVYDFFRINGLIPYQPLGEWPIPFSLFIALIFLSIALVRQNTFYHRMAETDPLTLLANRRKFDDSLKEEWNRCYRMGSPLSLIMADVDHFKEYNDAYGHKAGDLYLCRIARILESHTRRIGDLAVRYGGEEFILLLPHMDSARAFSLAETIRYSVCHMDNRSDCDITISMGIATTIPTKGKKPENLILEADAAMYEAKRTGRNRTVASTSFMI
jgi:diguanylate cyclase (GGDEF)-like protein